MPIPTYNEVRNYVIGLLDREGDDYTEEDIQEAIEEEMDYIDYVVNGGDTAHEPWWLSADSHIYTDTTPRLNIAMPAA